MIIGKDTGIPAVFTRGDTSDMTEERIAHILSEASQLMKPQSHEDSHSNDDSKSPNHGQVSINFQTKFCHHKTV